MNTKTEYIVEYSVSDWLGRGTVKREGLVAANDEHARKKLKQWEEDIKETIGGIFQEYYCLIGQPRLLKSTIEPI